MWSSVPSRPNSRCAVARSNSVTVAPARLSLSPNPTMPEIV
jgi:hypothetical protein